MQNRTRFYDLRASGVKWEWPISSLDSSIISPSGEKLTAVNLPGASICADFLVTPNSLAWAGVTVGVHERDFDLIRSTFELATNPIVKLIPLSEGVNLYRYKDFSGWGWLEINWLAEDNIEMATAQTNGVLWYTIPCPKTEMPKVVILALENIDYMLKEGPEGMVIPDLAKTK
jgi:hypothetical protein